MSCKGICDRMLAPKPVGVGRYASGQKRCQACCAYITCITLRCPCCNGKLRTKPRNTKYKNKLRSLNDQ